MAGADRGNVKTAGGFQKCLFRFGFCALPFPGSSEKSRGGGRESRDQPGSPERGLWQGRQRSKENKGDNGGAVGVGGVRRSTERGKEESNGSSWGISPAR